jgi:hypothetical protein
MTINAQHYVVLNPVLTTSAYQNGAFYDYYVGICDIQCTINIPVEDNQSTGRVRYASNYMARNIFSFFNTPTITDNELVSNPSLIVNKTLVVMHSEYVRQKEFNIITAHNDTLYLYPNALFARVNYNENSNMMSLSGGHSFDGTENAFNWTRDNTRFEYNNCSDMKFEDNMVNCYASGFFDVLRLVFMVLTR